MQSKSQQYLLYIIYTLIMLLPLLGGSLWGLFTLEDGVPYLLGRITVLAAFPILALQPVLAARLSLLDRICGLDRVMMFHRRLAMKAGILVLFHPLLLAAGLSWWGLLFSFDLPWYYLLGKGALFALLLLILSSLGRKVLGISWELWKKSHTILALLLVSGGYIHSVLSGSSLTSPPMIVLWTIYLAAGLAAQAYRLIIVPEGKAKAPWQITRIEKETEGVHTLTFAPRSDLSDLGKGTEGAGSIRGPEKIPFHRPGQFHFITFFLPDRKREEHPFTISSAPESGDEGTGGTRQSTIKALGDFTSRIGDLPEGTQVSLEGPFGRFSYLDYPGEEPLVFLAGGIGITPFISMIRHLHATGSQREVHLLYGNRPGTAPPFRKELEAIAASGQPELTLQFLEGEVKLESLPTGPNPGFYLCGPPGMMKQLRRELLFRGIPEGNIHFERFEL